MYYRGLLYVKYSWEDFKIKAFSCNSRWSTQQSIEQKCNLIGILAFQDGQVIQKHSVT